MKKDILLWALATVVIGMSAWTLKQVHQIGVDIGRLKADNVWIIRTLETKK